MLKTISRFLIGILFTFSGFVKAVDPMGSAIKIKEYFEIIGLYNIGSIGLILAILLSTAEFILGFALLTGLKVKKVALPSFVFLAFFTILTLYSAVFSPVSDCGCFGDAIKLGNWETFFKNLVFLPAAWYIYYKRNDYTTSLSSKKELYGLMAGLFFVLSISFYGVRNLPILDFRPYKIGNNIEEQMTIPQDAEQPEYNTIFVLEKDGVKKEFDEHNYPYTDSTWVYVESKTTLIKEGFQPAITNFVLETTNGEPMNETILGSDKPVFLMIMPKITDISTSTMSDFIAINTMCIEMGYSFYGVTSSLNEDILAFDVKHNAGFDYLNADETLLKTIIRSNPGLVIMQHGTILGKYSPATLPKAEKLKNPLAYTIKNLKSTNNELMLGLWSLMLTFFIFLIYKIN